MHRWGRSPVHCHVVKFRRFILLCSVLWAAIAVQSPGAQPGPPADPSGLTRERLACGLEVWVSPPEGAPGVGREGGSGEVYLSLVVRSGAIDERDTERGAAFIAKQAAGIERPGIDPSMADRFRSGFSPGDPAFTPEGRGHSAISHALVEFRLVFDAADTEAMGSALSHARALLDGWSPADAAIERAVGMVAGRAPPDSADARARVAVARSLFAGHPIGDRPLLPDADAIESLTPGSVRGYIGRSYVPSDSVLIVVGDVDPGEVLDRAQRAFAGVGDRPGRGGVPALDVSDLTGRVSAHVIEGYPGAELSLIAFSGRGQNGSLTALDRKLIDGVAAGLVGDRLLREIGGVEPDLLSIDTYAVGWLRGSHLTEVSVRTAPPGAANAARTVGSALARMHRDGWTETEIQAARAQLLEALRTDADLDAPPGPVGRLASLVAAVMHDEDWVPRASVLKHAERLLAATTDGTFTERALELFDPDRFNLVMLTPEPADGVGEALGQTVRRLARGGPPPARAGHITGGLPDGGGVGSINQIAHDPATDVWTATLGNGVVARVKALEDRPGAGRFDPYRRPIAGRDESAEDAGVTVRVALGAGLVIEDERTLGRTRDAAAAWSYPSMPGSGLGAPSIRAWMRDRGLALRVFESEHRLVLEVNGPPGSARDAIDLAAALIDDPGVDARFVDRAVIENAWSTPALDRLGALVVGERDPRAASPPDTVRIDAGAADAWLRRLAAAPIEASVVGSFDPESVVSHLPGSLGTLDARAFPERPDGVWGGLPGSERRVTIQGESGEYVHAVTFADMAELGTVRPMVVASRAIDAEIRSRAEEQGVEGRAWLWLGEGIPDRVTLVIRIEGDADAVRSAPGWVDDTIAAFMDGRTEEAAIGKQIERAQREVDRAWERRAFWAARLSTLSWSGLEIDSLSGLRPAYAAITPALVRETLARCIGAGVHKRVTVLPDADARPE